MTDLTPAPGEPAQPDPEDTPRPAPGFTLRIEEWLQRHVAPDMRALRGDLGDLHDALAAHASVLQVLAGVTTEVIKAASPALGDSAAALLARAEKAHDDAAAITASRVSRRPGD